MPYKYSLILSLLLLPLYSQTQNYLHTYEKIDTKSGLSNGNITALLQDSRGLMWIGSNDGLNMYDGTSFTNYRSKPNENSIAHSLIRHIAEDKKGNLWIATKNGLSYFDFANQKFKNFNQQTHAFVFNDINTIHIDPKGWVLKIMYMYSILRLKKL